jgi:ABC-type glucose/galactose transport system permease subunit
MYIVNKIRATNSSLDDKIVDSEAGVTNYSNFIVPKENEQGAANSFSRIKHVLCYDTTMAVYIVIFIGWVVWLATGVAKRLGADEGGNCDSDIQGMNVAISCGYMYLSMVFVAFGCSLCCLR